MFFRNRHRQDLVEARDREAAALRLTIDVLAEQIEWLRWQLSQTPHASQVLPPANPTEQPLAASDTPPWLSEEEEDILALKLHDHISRDLADDLAQHIRAPIRVADLEPSE